MIFPLHLQTVSLPGHHIDLVIPDAEAVKSAYQKGLIAFPYWSKLWPAAYALAAFLVAHPAYTQNKAVLELGAGLGLPSLVAAENAGSVLCTDMAEDALLCVEHSATYRGLTNFRTAVIDWHHLPENLSPEVLLLSDINYAPESFNTLLKTIEDFLQRGTTILLSTPQRLMAKDFISSLLPYCKQQEEQPVTMDEKEAIITVMVLQKMQWFD